MLRKCNARRALSSETPSSANPNSKKHLGGHMTVSAFKTGLDQNRANHTPLTPLSLISRAADVFPQKLAVIYGDLRLSWGEVEARCRRLASALARRGIKPGDTVAVMLPNIPAMVEAHF